MLIECPGCGAKGNVDEAKRPVGVFSVRCPKCQASIPLPPPPSEAVEAVEVTETVEPSRIMPAPEASSPSAPEPAGSEPASPPVAKARCRLCETSFSRDDMVRFGDNWVCAACKPEYVQMLAQGVSRPNDYRYAGFWIRFCAKVVDGLILMVLNVILTTLLAQTITKGTDPAHLVGVTAAMSLFQFAAAATYACYFLSSYQATPGKLACGLRVVVPEGGTISWQRGLGRYFAELLSSLIMCIGYLMAAFDEEKRALHDRICATRVVYK